MAASVGLNADWVLPAGPPAVGQLRRLAADFVAATGASDDVVEAVALAVSETVTNAVVHAYDREGGQVGVSCRVDRERVVVEVVDEGCGITGVRHSAGGGHGLALVGSLAQALRVASGPNGRGTVVTMTFGPVPPLSAPPGLEMLCRLAVETIADASCVNLVRDGVLRRFAAEVANEPALSEWLRTAVPPAKPGTATWAVLREGGARLVIHNPAVPRSAGGPGERLNLTWWLAIALPTSGKPPVALWGVGGREGGQPVPSKEGIRSVTDAARGDLAQPAAQATLRTQLAAMAH